MLVDGEPRRRRSRAATSRRCSATGSRWRSCRPTVEPGAAVEVDVRGKRLAGQVVKHPFVEKKSADRWATSSPTPTPRSRRCSSSSGLALARRAVQRHPRGPPPGAHGLDLAPGLQRVRRARGDRGGWPARNRPCGPDLVCFAGAGAYDHEIAVGRAPPRLPVRVRHRLHAVPARGRPGRAAGAVRVPDAALPPDAASRSPTRRSTTAPRACVEAVNLAVAAAGRPDACG